MKYIPGELVRVPASYAQTVENVSDIATKNGIPASEIQHGGRA
jgi:hypothetical protein